MFIMVKKISILLIVFLCLVVGIEVKSYAQPMTSQKDFIEQMKKHIEEMKIKNPKKYEEMVKGAGGNITYCTDCHKEMQNENLQIKGGMGGKDILKNR